MDKRKIAALIVLLLFGLHFLIISCGSGSSETISNPPLEEESELNQTIHPKIENFIASDLMGGIFRASMANMEATIRKEEKDSTEVGKVSRNIDPPNDALSDSMLFDASFVFQGLGGDGSLTLIIEGSGNKKHLSETVDTVVAYQFSPLSLRFLFHNYAFGNRCLGLVHLDGEIACTIEGNYDINDRDFNGTANCSNGPREKTPVTLLYMTQETDFEVGFNSDLAIDGDPFQYDSYRQEGDISIDGKSQKIEDLIPGGSTCS